MKQSVVYIVVFLLSLNSLKATHIVGGEMNYRYIGNNQYRINLTLYIDCVNGLPAAIQQDLWANIGVFSKKNDSLLGGLSFQVLRSQPVRVSKTNYDCIKIPPNACVDAYFYDTLITLPNRDGGYVLSFQRCCRNRTILNLINPESTGENIWMEIPDTTFVGTNSNPKFKQLPPNFLCTNTPLIFDHSATDFDGDSLVYEFFHPFTGATTSNPRPSVSQYERPPFSQIVYESGYDYVNSINSSPAISLDRKTGLLKLTPTLSGQFVIGIIVKEYRKGVLIGFTHRDYQFNIQECVFETTSAFTTPEINCNKEVNFINTSSNADSYFWNFGDSSNLADTSKLKSPIYTYPKSGYYTVTLIARVGNCADTFKKQIYIYDKIPFKLPKDTLLCKNAVLKIFPDTFYKKVNYQWNTGSKDSFITVSQEGLFILTITQNDCIHSDSIKISIDDIEFNIFSDSIKCNYRTQTFVDAKVEIIGKYKTLNWTSEPPNLLPNNYSQSSFFTGKTGKYKVSGINENNCPFEKEIEVGQRMEDASIRMPNVFTPNSDGYNNVFPEQTPNYLYKINVYNRWGILVYQAENVAWNGENFPEGTYFYLISYKTCVDKEYIDTHGVVHLLK